MASNSAPIRSNAGPSGLPTLMFSDVALWRLALVAAVFSFVLGSHFISAVWQRGYFADPDDAMRMVQVRDLLAGQSWFDMTTYRLDPGHGHFIHWSRIVDVLIALLLEFFGLFLAPERAERAMRLAYPFMMLVLLFTSIARSAVALLGRMAVIPALAIAALSGFGLGQFHPGRIDHHSIQIVLLVFMLAFTIEGMEKPSQAIKAACAAAISLAVSVENLPFIAVMAGIWPVLWVVDGARYSAHVYRFNLAFVVSALVVYAATVAPSRWFMTACDAFSASYLLPLLIGASGMIFAAAALKSSKAFYRMLAVGVAGVFTLGIMRLHSPACLGSPLSGVDPLVRNIWLEHVNEARPALTAIWLDPSMIPAVGSAFLCALIALLPAWFETGSKRLAWGIAGAFIVAGLAASLWQVRAISSLQPLVILGGAWIILKAGEMLAHRGMAAGPILALFLALPISATGWATAATLLQSWRPPASTAPAPQVGDESKCMEHSAYEQLRTLPQGLIMSPLDIGAHIQAYTNHASVAAGYHRNNRGNRVAIEVFTSDDATARNLTTANGARYVVVCPGLSEMTLLIKMAPGGLAARLKAGDAPNWLEPLSKDGDALRVFRVR